MKRHPISVFFRALVLMTCLLSWKGGASAQDVTIPLEWQVIKQTNDLRASLGLPPLAYNPLLTRSAREQSRAMADDGFFSHENPNTGSTPKTRVAAQGYSYSFVGENIAAGYATADEVMTGWINSPGHYANLISPDFREIGVGYIYRDSDPQNLGHYWTQNFGARANYFPIVIDGEAYLTTDPLVEVYIYGDNAIEMRIGIQGQPLGAWQAYQPQTQFTLPSAPATYTLIAETRDAAGNIRSATDEIILAVVGGMTATPSSGVSASGGVLPPETPSVATVAPSPTALIIATPLPLPSNTGQIAAAPALNPDEPERLDVARRLPWWAIIPILMLLLILLFHAIHYLRSNEIWMIDSSLKWRCRIPRIALVIYLLLMAGIIGYLTKGLWEESGKIIWQIDNQRSTFALYDDYTDELRELHNFEQGEFGCVGCHVFSPESERMVFTADRMTGDVYEWDGEKVNSLAFRSSYMSFSPDGQRMVVARNDEDLYLYDFGNESLTPLDGAAEPAFIETMPAWSEDGKTIIFARSETPLTGLDNRLSMPLDLFYISVEGGQISRLTGASDPGVFEYYPTISPDGRWIAFTRHGHETTYADPLSEVWLISVTGGTARRLAANDAGEGSPTTGNSMAVWSQDSNWLAFGSKRQDATFDVIVTAINADGSSENAKSLIGAFEIGIFEDRPAWWVKPSQLSFGDFLRRSLLWMLPLIPLILLVRLSCPESDKEEFVWKPLPPRQPIEPTFLSRKLLRILWEPQPTLVIGLGASGRHVLTQLKKNLLDAGLEHIPDHIALLALTTGKQSEEQRAQFRFAGVELDDTELVFWSDHLVDIVRSSNQDAALHEWVEKDYLLGLGDHVSDPQTGLDGQRVLGRLALINNLRGSSRQTGVNLWDHLNELAQRAIDQHRRLRVMMVSETGDDVASGQFIDVTYLMRLIEQQNELEMRVIAHIVTDRALSRSNEPARQANTIAFLRELSRFQLANNTPQIMKYSVGDGESVPPFDGIFRDRLIDELYLYDGENELKPLNTIPSKYGIYPALADFIAAWMDTALHDGGLVGWRDRHLLETHKQQRIRRELMLSSGGIYQYRLPFADLLRDITLKYAGQVLHMLLMGNNPTSSPRLDPGLATEAFIKNQNSQNLAIAFLGGYFGGTQTLSVEWSGLIDALAKRNSQQAHAMLKKLEPLNKGDETAWQAWLGNTMVILLNGAEHGDALEKRGAKLPLVLEVLKNLADPHGIFSQLISQVEQMGHSNGETAISGLNRLGELSEEVYQNVFVIAEAVGSVPENNDSLYRRLQRKISDIGKVWEEYERIQTRKYIFKDEEGTLLSEKWYTQYMVEHVSEGLEQLYWQWLDNRLQLVIRLAKDEPEIPFEPNHMQEFETALLHLGQHFAARVQDEESLASILSETELNRDHIQETAQNLFGHCGVSLSIQTGIANSLDKSLLLSLNKGVAQTSTLKAELESSRQAKDILLLNITDPFSLSLIQMADSIPLSGIPTIQTALAQYNQDEAIVERSTGLSKPTAAFAAEANALYYERRLHLLEQSRRVFHPVVVSGLVNDERVRVYLLAAAAQQEWRLGSELRFGAPEWSGVLLEARKLNDPVHGVLMDGLLSFIQLISDPLAHQIYNRYLNDDSLQAFWDKWDIAQGQAWRDTFGSRTPSAQILEDLIAITRIIIYEMLE